MSTHLYMCMCVLGKFWGASQIHPANPTCLLSRLSKDGKFEWRLPPEWIDDRRTLQQPDSQHFWNTTKWIFLFFFCCAVLVNCWCACKNYKYEHVRNNEVFMFFWNTRTGTILGPNVCTNLFSCNANVLSNAARVVRKDLFWQRGTHESHPEFFSHARWQLILLLQYWSCDSTPAL